MVWSALDGDPAEWIGTDWTGLGWIGLDEDPSDWIGIDRNRLDWIGPVGLDRLDYNGTECNALGRIRMYWDGLELGLSVRIVKD